MELEGIRELQGRATFGGTGGSEQETGAGPDLPGGTCSSETREGPMCKLMRFNSQGNGPLSHPEKDRDQLGYRLALTRVVLQELIVKFSGILRAGC